MTQPTPLTDQQLAEIEARANAATKGPWTVELEQCDCSDGLCGHGTYVSAVYANGERRTDFVDFPDEDWQFVIRARTAVPALLAEVRTLRAELERERENYQAYRIGAEGAKGMAVKRIAELEEERRPEWLRQGLIPHTPRICECGHSHHAHTVPEPHSCFAHGKTCPCPAYRQMAHDEAVAHVARKQAESAAAAVGGEDTRNNR